MSSAALRNLKFATFRAGTNNSSILGDKHAPDFTTINLATGKKTQFYQVDDNKYKSFLPEFMAEEMLQNHQFIENPGYYNGEKLEKSHAILEEKLVGVKEFAGTVAAWKA